jgi:polysaccharide biosynthesis transport protein
MLDKDFSFNFTRYWLIIKRRWLPGLLVFPPIFVLVFITLASKKPVYVAEGTLRFQKTNTTSSLTGVGKEIGDLTPLAEKTNPLSTETEVIRSANVVKKIIDRLNLKSEKGVPIKLNDFLKQLTVNEVQKTDVLKVSYKDTNPKTAAKIVNTLMAVYLEHNLSFNRAEAAAARKFLERQLPNAELTVRKAEGGLRSFKEKNKIVSVQEESTQAVGMIGNLQKQISDIKSQISDVSAQSKAIRAKLGMTSEQAVAVASLSQSSGVQDILKEVQQVESLLADKRAILQETHPEIIKLENKKVSLKNILKNRIGKIPGSENIKLNANLQIGDLQQKLSAQVVELETKHLGLDSELATLSNLEASYRQRLNVLPRLEQQQRELERNLDTAKATYTLLAQRLQESRIAENQNIGNVRVISNAQVPETSAVSPNTSYYVAGIIGLLASLSAIYLLEATDKSIKTIEEAKELTGLTLLGVIPYFNKSPKPTRNNRESELFAPKVVVRDTPRSPISEAYRMLRANLKFMSADKELKVIVVTSSVPKEGKSTVAANLAAAMAQMERKVLLVDGDLHRPSQHKIWDLPNNKGLSNVIVGQLEIVKAIKRVMDNLDVLTSGVVPPSPASLLDSKRMASLIESFSAFYDFVIIDAPSLNLAADAATLGQMADGVLLVVRPGVVDVVNATLARELLEKSGQNVLGQVVNAVIPQNERHSNYYFEQEYYSQETVKTIHTVASEK